MAGKRRRNGGARFVQLHHWILSSTAYTRASLAARCLLIEVMRRYNGQNNGEISMSVREAADRLHTGKNRASQAFIELQRLGFIKIKKRGSFNRKVRHATTWILTMHEYGNRPATKDFARWDEIKTRYPPQVPRAGWPPPISTQIGPHGTRHRYRQRPSRYPSQVHI